jgi:hypothetical protein
MTIWSAETGMDVPAELTGILGDLAEVGSLEFDVNTCVSAYPRVQGI